MATELLRILTDEQITDLLKLPNRRYPIAIRNYAMMQVLINTGIRASELIGHEKEPHRGGIRIQDVNWETGEAYVKDAKDISGKQKTRKNKIGRPIVFNTVTMMAINSWYNVRKTFSEKIKKDELLFTTLKGTKIDNGYFRRALQKYGKKCGIEHLSPHDFRHTYATKLYTKTKDIKLVQKVLGHSNIQETEIYIHISHADIANAMREF